MSVQPAARRFHGKTHLRIVRSATSLRDMPWWTAADAAELDLLERALLKGIEWHLARCPVAKARQQEGYPFWCGHLSEAVLEVVDWRDMRESYSRAVWLRALLEARP